MIIIIRTTSSLLNDEVKILRSVKKLWMPPSSSVLPHMLGPLHWGSWECHIPPAGGAVASYAATTRAHRLPSTTPAAPTTGTPTSRIILMGFSTGSSHNIQKHHCTRPAEKTVLQSHILCSFKRFNLKMREDFVVFSILLCFIVASKWIRTFLKN